MRVIISTDIDEGAVRYKEGVVTVSLYGHQTIQLTALAAKSLGIALTVHAAKAGAGEK